MITHSTSHGPTQTYLRWQSINQSFTVTIYQLPTMLLPTLEPQNTSLMILDPHNRRFGPPFLANWLPDSGATSQDTPLFSHLCDIKSCSVPVSLVHGSTKMSTHKGTTECHFTTDDGLKSIPGPHWCPLCWRSKSQTPLPDCSIMHSKLQCPDQEQNYLHSTT